MVANGWGTGERVNRQGVKLLCTIPEQGIYDTMHLSKPINLY